MQYEEFLAEQLWKYEKSCVLPAAERRERLARELRQLRLSGRPWILRRAAALVGGLMVTMGEQVSRWSMATPAPTA